MFEWRSTAALWVAVVLSGLYHGANPGMGWPLAVSAALMERRRDALPKAVAALGAGHFLAMLVILIPFSMLTALLLWERQIRIAAGMLVIGLGIFLLLYRRHPRFLSRVPPHRLVLWSFLIATAHGAALMLAPIYLGLCTAAEPGAGHAAAAELMRANALQAVLVAALHTLAMVTAGGLAAAAVYYWFGLKALSTGWFNLDRVWALSLIFVGALAIAFAA
ncbi:hypothetical protein K9U39_09095 [Rhodoblastus acidophilus]|uniref:Uncharacterized protein n=1 Tax=Candidatus Rhodoblastus alkanivorans TaxID=2954117 RepID=A0ABS9Z994_9HYPH|nr:hypothetical protein [Candidatus Rhodoblastus alkanivorans]MCI4677881.1 hypothetical protein [Candidatus Rhodoblastus alkanivorans]MCI4683777.1 hypothetical protein [Candidatus Rhodoblastus alkanivorans]MDI4641095.1 hypothetical protein [Rhodoblastus acidophilus]